MKIPFVFANPVQDITPLGEDPARLQLAGLAARMWASFVADLDPNGHGGQLSLSSCALPRYTNDADLIAVTGIPKWPRYASPTHHQSTPANFVFRLPRGDSYVEKDDYRAEGIAYINSIPR